MAVLCDVENSVDAGSPLAFLLATALPMLGSQRASARASAPWCVRVEQAGAAGRDSPRWDA